MTAATVNIRTTKVYEAILQAWCDRKKGICLEGGTYSSKTYSALQFLIYIAQKSPRALDSNIVSESVPHLKGGAMRDFFNILGERVDNNPFFNQTEHIYRRPGWNGVNQFLSADNMKALGMRRDILFINEADTLTWETARELISRTNVFVILDWNPRSEFWAHEYYLNDPNWAYDHSTYLDAIAVIPLGKRDDIESLGRKDPNYQNIYVLGERGKVEGLVYPHFEQVDELPMGAYFYGMDYGGSSEPTVLVKNVIVGSALYSQEMFYKYGLDVSQIAREMDLAGVLGEPVFPDPENPLASMELKQKHHYNIADTVKGKGSVEFGIQKVNEYYQFWTKQSLNCIKEQRNYKYIKAKTTGNGRTAGEYTDDTTHAWSHGMDARRYAVASVKRVGATSARPTSYGVSLARR